MALLDNRMTAGASGATSGATCVLGPGVGSTGAASRATANVAAAMGSAADTSVTITSDAAGATGVTNTRAGAAGDTCTSITTVAMVSTIASGATLTTGTSSHEDKTNKTQATIRLPSPKANPNKDLHKTPINNQRRLMAHFHIFLLHDSPNITHINDAENRPVVGIINIPKSSTIWVLRSFGVRTNLTGGYSPTYGKIIYFTGHGSSTNPTQAMVLPREVLHKTPIRVPNQDNFERKLINTQAFPLFKKSNFRHDGNILKAMHVIPFLVYNISMQT